MLNVRTSDGDENAFNVAAARATDRIVYERFPDFAEALGFIE
jgi:hypothetical protein